MPQPAPHDALGEPVARPRPVPLPLLAGVFVLSGFAALVYQVVWERALHRVFGVNSESVTIVVAAFLLGLGVGSAVGGVISKDPRRALPRWFGALELSLALFGAVSLALFRAIEHVTAGGSPLVTFASAFALLVVPTSLMGATLPILVAHATPRLANVGLSVGMLYFVNTLGSAIAAFATATFLLGKLGQQGSVLVAVAMNALAGGTVLFLSRGEHR